MTGDRHRGREADTGCVAQHPPHLLVTPASQCDPRGSLAPAARTWPSLSRKLEKLNLQEDLGAHPEPEQTLQVAGGEVYLAAFHATGASGLSSTTKRESAKHRLDWIGSSAKMGGIFQGSLRS